MTKENRRFYILIGIIFIVNLVQSASFELSYDESYYWIFSQYLSFGHYDHPPMVGWMIKLGTLLFDGELGVRFVFNLAWLGTIILIWKMIPVKNAILFGVLSLSFALIQASGFLALPDTPLLFFATAFLYIIQKYLKTDNLKNTIALSLVIPLMFYSKYHGMAVVVLTTMAYPMFLKRKSFWAIVFATIVLYLPHMYWQYTHEFISFAFHFTKRVEKHFDAQNIAHYLYSQVALFGFLNFFIFLYVLTKVNLKDAWNRILFFNTAGFLILLFFFSFRNQIEANWTGTACMAMIPLVFAVINENKGLRRAIYISSAFPVLLILALRVVLILPTDYFPEKEADRLNEIKGWKKRIAKIEEAAGTDTIVGDSFQITAKLSFYTKRKIPALHLGSRSSQYSILNLEKSILPDQPIAYLTSHPLEGSLKIETGYKHPIYLIHTTLNKLAARYGTTYEEIIRN